MKKNKLIELLENIPGNPDVVFWNGYVEDWQNIDSDLQIHEMKRDILDKSKYKIILEQEAIEYNKVIKTDEEFEQWYKNNKYSDWKINNVYHNPCAKIQKKKVVVLQVNERGKKDFNTFKY